MLGGGSVGVWAYSIYRVKVAVCPGIWLEGWLKWFAFLVVVLSAVGMWSILPLFPTPSFCSSSSERAVRFFVLFVSFDLEFAPTAHAQLFLAPCSFLPYGSAGKESACNAEEPSSIPWVGMMPWRRERLPTPVFWPGLYSPWGRKETTERLWVTFTSLYSFFIFCS